MISPELNPDQAIDFPNGTCSGVVDHKLGILRIFAEPEPDPEDWKLVQEYAARVAGGTWTCYAGPCIDIFDIRVVPHTLAVVA